MTFRRIVRMDPEPETLAYACGWALGTADDGAILCGKPGEIWIVFHPRGAAPFDRFYCPECYRVLRRLGTNPMGLPEFDSIPFLI